MNIKSDYNNIFMQEGSLTPTWNRNVGGVSDPDLESQPEAAPAAATLS